MIAVRVIARQRRHDIGQVLEFPFGSRTSIFQIRVLRFDLVRDQVPVRIGQILVEIRDDIQVRPATSVASGLDRYRQTGSTPCVPRAH